ncbi:MAG: redoxin domain-containing protein [Caldisericia bacterium]|nr:redoxin domain-containing protein [Caldisericia bacterium]
MLRRWGVLLVVFLLVGMSVSLNGCRIEKNKSMKDAGSWELPVVVNNGKAVENETIKMPDYMEQTGAKAILLEFNATWGEPCLAEIPYYQDLYDQYKEQGLVVISIFIDNSEYLRAQIVNTITNDLKHVGGEGGKITFPVCWDLTQKVKELYGITSIPVTYLINKENKIVYEDSGFTEELFEDLDKEIQQLLNY